MTLNFLSRLVGLVIFGIVGARFGADPSVYTSLNLSQEASATVMGMTGVLFGLVATPGLPFVQCNPCVKTSMRCPLTNW